MNPQNKIYIAGPIAGDDGYREKFFAAENFLALLGWRPINPTCLPDNLNPDDYMPICMALLNQADAIVMLHDSAKSPGAKLELQFANYQKKVIYPGLEYVPLWKEDENAESEV